MKFSAHVQCHGHIASLYTRPNASDLHFSTFLPLGIVLADFLEKQSAAAAKGMVPELFLRRFVDRDISLQNLSSRYHFEESQVGLISLKSSRC